MIFLYEVPTVSACSGYDAATRDRLPAAVMKTVVIVNGTIVVT
jgi:hypothetical protein